MSSVGTQLNTFQDVSRRITVAVFHHRGNPAQSHWNEKEILVGDPDMVAIGGGGTDRRQRRYRGDRIVR